MSETLFGSGQTMDCDHCRFVCKSMKRGLAIVKVWILRIVSVVAGVRSILCIIIKDALAVARQIIMQHQRLTYMFVKCERASIPSVNVMV